MLTNALVADRIGYRLGDGSGASIVSRGGENGNRRRHCRQLALAHFRFGKGDGLFGKEHGVVGTSGGDQSLRRDDQCSDFPRSVGERVDGCFHLGCEADGSFEAPSGGMREGSVSEGPRRTEESWFRANRSGARSQPYRLGSGFTPLPRTR
jgi:hypothetical protein